MGKRHIFSILFIFLIGHSLTAQQSKIYTHTDAAYHKALSLYNAQQYIASQVLFQQIQNEENDEHIKGECAYYIANCAVRLNLQNADALVENFVENYPTSTKHNQAFNDVGDYYFRNSKYAYALKWYSKVDESDLGKQQQEDFYFRKAYVLFHTNQKKQSKRYFNKVEHSKKHGGQAKYYLGFLAYQGDDYKEASSYFDQVKDQEKYQEKMGYFQADMNFKLGNFEKAIDLASQRLPLASEEEERSQLNKIIGESFFNLKNYDKALPHLNDYKGLNGKWSNTDHYQLGYVYFKRHEFEAAISEFNKIIDGDNYVAQNAYYHLAQCYLNTDKKSEALHAFKNASEMQFDAKITEDAYLNYAKLSYAIGNSYQSVPEVLMSFIKAYPNSAENETIEQLLIDSYITSKNYKAALELLEHKSGYDYKVAYQKVAFYRAIEIYNSGDFNQALELFKTVINEPKTAKFTTRALYWKAECEYLLNNYNDAVITYKQFAMQDSLATFVEAKNLNYQLGYAYFKQKDYPQAITHFKNYTISEQDDKVRLNDAYLRLGDSYFVTADYWKAMETYNVAKTMNGIDADYAHFQKAISYGFVGKPQEKIEDLKLFLTDFPASQYKDDALYELGNTYVLVNNTQLALQTYDELNYKHPQSSYVLNSLLKQGLVHYNSDANEQALNKFKQVVASYPGSPEANQAVATARLIYVDLDRVDEYVSWVKTLDFVEVTDADLDNATYEAAEKQFLQGNSSKAIEGFSGYLERFTNGIHALQAHFYLGQLYYKNDDITATIPHYKYVVAKERNEFTEQALVRLSEVYLKQVNWEDVKPILVRLETEADYPQNIVFAQSNLMKVNYQLALYTEAVTYADKILQNPKMEDAIKSDAQVIIARSAIKTGNDAQAKAAYAKVQEIATGALAAESLYYDAFFTNKSSEYELSNKKIQNLTKNYSGYKYYAAKSLVLMAKNFYELEDSYQATYILEKVIENFSDYEDVVAEATTELQHIKEAEAKRNSSIDITPIDTNTQEDK
ncbi:MAG: tetratricopeptide repeat protein [Flavobacteriaceae bacterium]